MGHRREVLGLGRCQADLLDVPQDLLGGEFGHLLGGVRPGEQGRRDLVDLLVGGLRRERNGNGQGVRVGVVERDRRLRVEIVEDLPDPIGFLGTTHSATLPFEV